MQKIPPEIAADLAALPFWIRRRTTVSDSGCILWSGPMTGRTGSQPVAWDPEQQRRATVHRRVYEITHEVRLHPSQAVFRTCWNPRCIRPAHLTLGDRGEHRAPIRLDHAGPGRPISRISRTAPGTSK